MTKAVKLIFENEFGDQEQMYPETHAESIFGLGEFINEYLSASLEVKAGSDLNKLTSGRYQGSRTYIINGVAVNNAPEFFNGYGSLTVNDINGNTCTQVLIACDGKRWTRGAGGQNKDFNEWRAF